MPEIGEKAPDFEMPADGGEEVSLAALKGHPFVLYFYPKDDTPGCTKEAIGFSEKIKEFDKLGVKVIGVSKDTLAKHAKFREKHSLSVVLAADEDGKTCEAFGVWVEKNMYGRKYMGIERATFLIDGKGVIRNIWRKVKVKGHVEAVLEAAETL
ncbi:thioredoxin-dependent thiol peroxidase [uncultured Sneathiella sp.]|jgi:peroxiredoxin Q/BCP|uniref:thioredoxin-dependent thiol peroxidase n=2 Tax=uncultured Sneathiella sp. TaxID=879315 RepID=UPI0030DD08DD|tara:strand:+ start:691 stop:1152 length:462 start_codon:yes stop_codon:yes gene_type:complete